MTYTVLLDVPNPDLKLKPGMTANVTIPVEIRSDVLRVPNAALRFRPDPEDVVGSGTHGPSQSSDHKSWTSGGGGGGGQNQYRNHGGSQAHDSAEKGTVVYVQTEQGKLKPIPVKTSITDGTLTAVESGELAEGQEIVTGLATARAMDSSGGMTGGRRRF